MIELHSHCCCSFLDGASHPHELVEQAVAYGYKAVALTDHNGLYGSMEFTQSAQAAGLQAITGAEISVGRVLPNPDPVMLRHPVETCSRR